MTTKALKDFHKWHDEEYVKDWINSDRMRDKERLPRLQMMVSLIPFDRQENIRVLDVGSGYGALSQVVLEAFPNSHVVCQDFSDPMFRCARQRLEKYIGRVTYIKSNLSDPEWTSELDKPFDAIVSAIAIHNVRIHGRIPSIYREILKLLKNGGCFLNSELVAPSGSEVNKFYQRWRLITLQKKIKEEKGPEKSLDELEKEQQKELAIPFHNQEGWRPSFPTLEEQLLWLRQAGFNEVDCFWKEMGQAIIGAYRFSK